MWAIGRFWGFVGFFVCLVVLELFTFVYIWKAPEGVRSLTFWK